MAKPRTKIRKIKVPGRILVKPLFRDAPGSKYADGFSQAGDSKPGRRYNNISPGKSFAAGFKAVDEKNGHDIVYGTVVGI
jgi:hypothetical protein